MGPVNGLAVVVAAVVAHALGALWYRPRAVLSRDSVAGFALLLIGAAMIGHMFARVGAATLGAKPWLYFMMSGGLAGAFVVPALVITHLRLASAARTIAADAAYWLSAYLAMGLTFYVLAR